MSEEPVTRPMQNLLTAVDSGAATVAMSPEDFVYIDRDCEAFKAVIVSIQNIMTVVGQVDDWGLGNKNADMISAQKVVDRFKSKANGALDGNSVYAVMEQHYKIVEDIQEVHRIARQRMMDADAGFAAEFTRLSAELPEKPSPGVVLGPYLLPDGSAR